MASILLSTFRYSRPATSAFNPVKPKIRCYADSPGSESNPSSVEKFFARGTDQRISGARNIFALIGAVAGGVFWLSWILNNKVDRQDLDKVEAKLEAKIDNVGAKIDNLTTAILQGKYMEATSLERDNRILTTRAYKNQQEEIVELQKKLIELQSKLEQ